MKRKVLFIPLDEVEKHLFINKRQDIKIVVPQIMTASLYASLKKTGRAVKPESIFKGNTWRHTKADDVNHVSEAAEWHEDIIDLDNADPFSISFANEKAGQDSHYHKNHWEIYFSFSPLAMWYKESLDGDEQFTELEKGGSVIVGPGVVHKMKFSGLTIIIECPSVKNDKDLIRFDK